MGFPNVMANLPDGSSGPGRHPTASQIWRTSRQKNVVGPRLENILPRDVRVLAPKTAQAAHGSS